MKTKIEAKYWKLYVAGELRDASEGGRAEVICPGTEERVGEVAWAGAKDAEDALAAAEDGFGRWSALSLAERQRWMSKLREALIAREEDLRLAVMWEMGKPWEETAEDYQIVDALAYFPEEMRRWRNQTLADIENTHRHTLASQPAGVAVAFLPWNFPLLCLGFKLGPALAAGCSIVVKPSPLAPLSAYLAGEICHEVGFPPGVINILTGPVPGMADVLLRSKTPRVVTIIGSSQAGRDLIRESATSIKRFSLELGGNAPALIFEDADLDRAVTQLAAVKFGNCGQICVAPNRFYVQRPIYDSVVQRMAACARSVRVGFGRESRATMRPLITGDARNKVDALVHGATAQGARLMCGGRVPAGMPKGLFYEPTVLADVRHDMEIAREEVFGPVASLIPFDSEKDAVRMANDTDAGLASYLWTRDADRIRRVSESLQFGEVMVNGYKWSVYLPHMGIKESGIGADCSALALEPYLVRKRVTVACEPRPGHTQNAQDQ